MLGSRGNYGDHWDGNGLFTDFIDILAHCREYKWNNASYIEQFTLEIYRFTKSMSFVCRAK